MKPSDGFFPESLRPVVDQISGQELRRQENALKIMGFYDAFQRDPRRRPLDAQILRVRDSLFGTQLAGVVNISLKYRGREGVMVWPPFPEDVAELSDIYHSYPHPDSSSVKIVSSFLRFTSKDNTSPHYVLLLTARDSVTQDDTPLSHNELQNSVPAYIIPEEHSGHLSTFAYAKPGTFNELTPDQAENFLNTELQRFTDAVNARS